MSITLLSGDCRDVLPTLPANSVHTCVTSPPYYGLRDYGTAQWDGGDAACDHAFRPDAGATSQRVGRSYQQGHPHRECSCGARRVDRQIGLEATPDEYLSTMVEVMREVKRVLRHDGTAFINMGDGYRDKQLQMIPARLAIALQADGWFLRSAIIWAKPNPMPESCRDRPTSAYEHVFLLTKRSRYYYDAEAVRETESPNTASFREMQARFMANPERHMQVTSASRELRADEVNDRRTQAGLRQTAGPMDGRRNCRNVWTIATHAFSEWGETSRQVRVAWDAAVDGKKRKASPDCPVHGDQAVRAPNARGGGHADGLSSRTARNGDDPAQAPVADCAPSALLHRQTSEGQSSDLPLLECLPAATPRSTQSHRTDLAPATSQPCSASAETDDGIARTSESPEPVGLAGHTLESNTSQDGSGDHPSARTADHSVDMSSCCCEWYITKTEKTSHFATFPPELAERCIKAGTSERGCCSACGAPWRRVTDTSYTKLTGSSGRNDASGSNGWDGGGYPRLDKHTTTTGWSPSCACAATTQPCTVLDPFAGAGTTLLVADRLQRNAIGIELNAAYTTMAMERVRADAPLLAADRLFSSWPPAEDPADARMAYDARQRDLFAEAAD